MLTEDMSQVPNPTDAVDEGSYHVRISKVDYGPEVKSEKGFPVVKLLMKVQDQGAMFGRVIPDTASLQSHALFKLKGYYTAVGYKPGSEGHDPNKLLDSELYVNVEHSTYEGKATLNIPPWSIRSLQEGPAKGKKMTKDAVPA